MSRFSASVRWMALVGLALALLSAGPPARAEADTNSPGLGRAEADSAAPAGRFITNAVDRFSITLPPGWQPMPRELANGLAEPLRDETRSISAYGFELESNTNSLKPPFVTLHFVRGGRVADTYLRMMDNPEVRRRVVHDMALRDASGVTNVSNITFDTNEHRLSFSGLREDEDGAHVRFWQHLIFTEQGSINMTCLAPVGADERWTVDFDRMLASLRLHSEMSYRPRVIPTDVGSVTRPRATKYFFIPGVVAVLAVARVISNYFSERVMSDEI